MPKRESSLYLQDIKDCIKKIEKYTEKLSFHKFAKDEKTVDAVVRNLEIIGEVASNMPKIIRTKYKKIPWKDIVGMRNLIIHEYFGVDLDIVWETIKKRVPELKKELRKVKIK